jgi:hypothetical protein
MFVNGSLKFYQHYNVEYATSKSAIGANMRGNGSEYERFESRFRDRVVHICWVGHDPGIAWQKVQNRFC